MDIVDDYFDSIDWDELKNEGSKVAMSQEAVVFFQSIGKSPTKQAAQAATSETETAKPKSPEKRGLTYPRMSSLTANEQSFYLAARYGHLINSQVQPQFIRLHPLVLAEQREFVEWALGVVSKGPPPTLKKALVQQGAALLAARQEDALGLGIKPLGLHKQLPLRKPSSRLVHFRPIQHLHSEGRVAACRPLEGINCKLPEVVEITKSRLPVSVDPMAEKLALEHSADIVLSPGALLALVDGAGKDLDLPLLIKQVQGPSGKSHRLLLLDKPLPAVSMSDYQKMSWSAKRATKNALFSFDKKTFDFSSMRVQHETKDFESELKNYTAAKDGQFNSNHAYSLWCLEHERGLRTADSAWGRQGCPIRLLVRSQCHGFQERDHCAPLFVHLGVKLEWRPEFGAEATTISETTRDWVAMTLRPEAVLLRARVNAENLQIIQVEAKDLKSISSEARMRGLDATRTFGALHTLLAELLQLSEGQYILRVEPKGAALYIFGQQTAGQAQTLNLAQEYAKGSPMKVTESMVGGPIDPEVVTPWCSQNQRVPATFAPRAINKPKKKKKKAKSKSPNKPKV